MSVKGSTAFFGIEYNSSFYFTYFSSSPIGRRCLNEISLCACTFMYMQMKFTYFSTFVLNLMKVVVTVLLSEKNVIIQVLVLLDIYNIPGSPLVDCSFT